MSNICELCRHELAAAVYEPERSTRGLKVHVCAHCGLVQSSPRIDRAERAPAAVSGGADWGNVRYGKGFRTGAAMAALKRYAVLTDEISLLDVGSNRGSFARAFLEAAPEARIVAVEPDERVADAARDLERTKLIVSRIEHAALESNRFDIVHSCHTIEHLASPRATLMDHWRILKEGGLLIVDAPNIALIGTDDIVEEWFIDKHLYHFSQITLARLIEASGFEIVAMPNPNDRVNLLFAAKKRATPPRPVKRNAAESAGARALIKDYVATRSRNLGVLSRVANEIAGFSPKRVALWGAGRLFDALVLHGGFDPKNLVALIDTHLLLHVHERHGVPLSGPEALGETDPHVIVVMSRSFAGEIARIAKLHAPKADIVLYTDLLAHAHLRPAA